MTHTIVQPKPGLFIFDPIIPHLFNDADLSEQEALAKTHVPHAMRVITTPVLPPLWAESALNGRRIWLKAMLDATFTPDIAQAFINGSGVEWDVVERDVGHCCWCYCGCGEEVECLKGVGEYRWD
jgi:hypothetical protein